MLQTCLDDVEQLTEFNERGLISDHDLILIIQV